MTSPVAGTKSNKSPKKTAKTTKSVSITLYVDGDPVFFDDCQVHHAAERLSFTGDNDEKARVRVSTNLDYLVEEPAE